MPVTRHLILYGGRSVAVRMLGSWIANTSRNACTIDWGEQGKIIRMWPDRRLLDLLKIEHPILLAPMAGAIDFELAVAVAEGGGLGSLPCAMMDAEQARAQIEKFRARAEGRPVNLNFFCHTPPTLNNAREAGWRDRLRPYYQELGIDPAAPIPTSMRMPFDAAFAGVVEDLKPEVVSF